jgi:hypothetical protein
MTGIETGVLMAYAAAASAVIGAYSVYRGGKNQEVMAKSQAQADEYNAEMGRLNAASARQQADAREEAQRRQARQVLGEQRAALSQAGAGLSGSAADVYGQSATNAELDALNIRYDGELQARGLLAGAAQDSMQAQISRTNARTARSAGTLNAASTLLAGASTAYGYARRPSTSRGAG